MLSLYEILKASKTGIAPDMWTALAGKNWNGTDTGYEVKELTGIPPLSIRSNGTILLDYLISGNMSQAGTPTPTTPIQPQETGERTGNLLDYTTAEGTSYTTVTQISGGISVSGQYYVRFRTVQFEVGKSYTMSWKANTISGTSSLTWRFHYADNTYSSMSSSGKTLTAEKEVTELLLYVSTGASCVVEFTEIMLNSDSTPLPYEPYGYKIPILSNSQTTNVYLGEAESTRRIKKWVFTGTEEWSKGNYAPSGGYQFFTPKPSNIADNSDWLITHFKKGSGLNGSAFASYLSLYPEKSILPENATANDFKTWLATQYAAGTPVTMWYVLADPTTGIVNEPLRKIGDYADTVSYEQAGVQIPTLHGQTVVDVETTLKPSEMYIKYQE